MSINFRPLSKHDLNFSKVIDLYKEAFPGIQKIPHWILQYKMGKGKAGSNIIYEHDDWIGFIYLTEYKDIVFVHFFCNIRIVPLWRVRQQGIGFTDG